MLTALVKSCIDPCVCEVARVHGYLQSPSTARWDIGIYWWDWFVLVGITTCDGWQWETPEFQAAWNLPLSGPSCQNWRVGTIPACTLIGEASLVTSKAVLGPLETIQKV